MTTTTDIPIDTAASTDLLTHLCMIAGVARFVSLVYKTKEKLNKNNEVIDGGEVARYTLVLGARYNSLVDRSLLYLDVTPAKEIADSINEPLELVIEAIAELKKSFKKTLDAHARGEQNEDYTKRGMYRKIVDGLNVHNDGTWQLFGLVTAKTVLKKGIRKGVNSAPLTIVKNKIRAELPIGKFREFAIDSGNSLVIKLNGDTLELTPA